MSAKKNIIIGCSIVAGVGFLIMAILIGWLAYVSQDIDGVKVFVSMPDEVKNNDVFTLDIQIVNERKSKIFHLADIDLSDDFLKGFMVVSSEGSKTSQHVPIVNMQSFTFDSKILPGHTNNYSFKLRAVQTGLFRGDVGVYEGSRSITSMAQVQVK